MMDLKIKLQQLYERVDSLKDQINTEEATKNAFVLPFIQILGYDIFNPTEVIPEFICDIGTKKGEKVDYVIKNNDHPILIIECKTQMHITHNFIGIIMLPKQDSAF
ncbi:hypothetical protein [Chryseobacterium gotjawalense]|uniref:hypothetical protein n=1 Tax=Chryseobacterium gotjawalense TaxID=3042315 RepID=UPI0029500772|nr:hypothetical protein [Chryseobacterium sp. wdc7]